MKAELKARRVVKVLMNRCDLPGVRYVGGCALGFGFARELVVIVMHPAGLANGWGRATRFLMN